MSKKKKKEKTAAAVSETRRDSTAISAPAPRPAIFWTGIVLLLVAAGAALMLALDHFAIAKTPGCGIDSACAQVTRGPWGRVPVLNWPVSLVGLAYFAGLLAAWISVRGVTTRPMRAVIGIGGLASLLFISVMAAKGAICWYCMTVHGANLAFLAMVFGGGPVAATSTSFLRSDLGRALAGFALVTVALVLVNWQTSSMRQARAAAELDRTTKQIIARSAASDVDPAAAVHAPPGGFTGRWRQGPADAPIRIVTFFGYQCKDCKLIETEVQAILARRPDVSLSVKHFPMSADCNPHLGGRSPHPNACWAARAAEAAGILRGADGFWQMHHALFARGGSFTDAEMNALLRQLGYDPSQFLPVMQGRETMERVQADIAEARALGLNMTPMIFINGVELRGFVNNPQALTRAVEALAVTNPPPGSPENDRPPLAAGKAIGDWKLSPMRALPPRPYERSDGPLDAAISVWVFGDYQQDLTAELDRALRGAMASGADIRYIFRPYPLDKSCNDIPRTLSTSGCWAARAAEAAGRLGGNDAYWKVHNWLLANQPNFNEAALRRAAPSLGLDANALVEQMASPELADTLSREMAAAKPLVPRGIPTLYVNGRLVAQWKLDDVNILDLIFRHAN